jgi:hypothetical protein
MAAGSRATEKQKVLPIGCHVKGNCYHRSPKRAGISLPTVTGLEAGAEDDPPSGTARTAAAVQAAFETSGVEFSPRTAAARRAAGEAEEGCDRASSAAMTDRPRESPIEN